MPVVEYQPEDFELVAQTGKQAEIPALLHRPYMDYYYTTSPYAKFYFSTDDRKSVKAMIGVEKMPFLFGENPVTVGFGHHLYSGQQGSGGLIFVHWVKSCQVPMEFGGNEEAHRLIQGARWEYFEGIHTYYLNPRYRTRPEDSSVTKLAKRVFCKAATRATLHKRLSQITSSAPSGLEIKEEQEYTEDLLPQTSPFTVRFAPPIDYLKWRYNTNLSFVKYRLFRLLLSEETIGYVVINDHPLRRVVAHCDATDPIALAHGVLLCLAEVGKQDTNRREVILASSFPAMQEVYTRFGFVTHPNLDRKFALGLQRYKAEVPRDTAQWLVNYDWGDIVLRPPFLDESEATS